MAHPIASISGLRGAFMEGARLKGPRVAAARPGCIVARAKQQEPEASRRAVLGLAAAGLASGSLVKAVLADAVPIKIGPPPPPSGGLPGTLNSDQARDTELPLKQRFYIQPLTPSEAAARAKESAKEIVGVKSLIDKKVWPSIRDNLRLKAEYLRYDLNTVISAKPKPEKQSLKEQTSKLFESINQLDYAAKTKNPSLADKYYTETVSALNDVLAKLS